MCVYACANMIIYNTRKVCDQHGGDTETVAHSKRILATLKNIKIDRRVFGVSERCYIICWLLRFMEVIKNPSPP